MKEVEARYVNLKYIDNNEWIFFSNYLSPKANQFESHDQVSILIYWASINTQIRMKAKIFKTSSEFKRFEILLFPIAKEENKRALCDIDLSAGGSMTPFKSLDLKEIKLFLILFFLIIFVYFIISYNYKLNIKFTILF